MSHVPKELDISLPQHDLSNLCHSHLKEQLPVRPGMRETRGMVIFVQHSDMSCASGTARRRAAVLYHHNNLVAGLLLSVQGKAGADLALRKRGEHRK